MSHDPKHDVHQALSNWLQTERLLGTPHLAVPPPAPAATTAMRTQSAGRAAAPRTPARAVADDATAPPDRAAPGGVSARVSAPGSAAGSAAALSFFADDPALPAFCKDDLPPNLAQEALAALDTGYVRACRRCRLHEHRTQTVFGVGNPRPDLVFVGEGPGADEDAQGIPFVGRAGQLLTRMIAAMTLTREQVYICNVVKCRPPGNRTPLEDEMATCGPFLMRQLAILRPKMVVALGRPATQTLLATSAPIGKLRGRFFDFPPPELGHLDLPPVKLMPTFHPAYLLRNPAAKTDAWQDLKQVMQVLGLKPPDGR